MKQPAPLEALAPGSRILVIRLRSLGDAVLTTPALQLLHRARPDLPITAALDRELAPLLEDLPFVDRVLPVERGRFLATLRAVRRERPGLVWNLHGGPTSRRLTALSGARYRAGYEHFAGRFAYNVRIPRAQTVLERPPDAPVHTAEHHAAGAFFLGAERGEIPPAQLTVQPSERERPYAVLHVAAAYETKRWSVEGFARIADRIEREYGLEPVLIAGPGQDALLERFPGRERLTGLDITALMRLLAGARLFVGNDSGPAHVAAAFQAPSVVVFGSSDSSAWAPWRTPSRIVETRWDCKPCPGDRCYAFEAPRCILSVNPQAVETAIDELLGGVRASGESTGRARSSWRI